MRGLGRLAAATGMALAVAGPGLTAPVAAAAPEPSASRLVPVAPARVLDTRSGVGAPTGAVPPGGRLVLDVTGRAGVPADGVSAVVLNLTVDRATRAGYVQAYPTGRSTPGAHSNLNVSAAGQTVAVLATVPVGGDGTVTLFSSGGGHLVADVTGYYAPSAATSAGRFAALTPARLLDTRKLAGKPGPRSSTLLKVTGRAGVPASGVSAVALNVVTTQPDAAGYVQVIPTDGPTRTGGSSNLNAARGQTIANLAVVPVGRDGQVTLYSSASTHLVVDVQGWWTDDSAASSTTGLYQPIVPRRLDDTRLSAERLTDRGALEIRPLGQKGVPYAGVSAVALGVTVVRPAGPGYVHVFPAAGATPGSASNLNVSSAGQTIAGAVLAPPGQDGHVTAFSTRSTDLVVDVFGWFLGDGAAAGELDQGFGRAGVSASRVGAGYSAAQDVALDAAGRIVLAGQWSRSFGLARLLPDGRHDVAFGGDGTVSTAFGVGARANAVVVQTDDKIIAAGHVNPTLGQVDADFALARYNTDGSLDTSFGTGGRVTTSFPDSSAYVSALLLQPDGRLVAVGETSPPDAVNSDVAVVRYLPDGRLDTSFGGDGVVLTDVGGPDFASSVTAGPDGTVVVGATSGHPDPSAPATSTWTLLRYRADGSLDQAFGGGDGIAESDLSPQSETLTSLTTQDDGRLVAVGHINPDGRSEQVAVARYLADGRPDTSFGGGDGAVATSAARLSEGEDVAVQPDGRIVVAGRAADDDLDGDPDWEWLLLRYDADGALDPAFGRTGVVRTPAGEQANALALEPDGQIVVAGCDCPFPAFVRGGFETDSSMVVARFDPVARPRT